MIPTISFVGSSGSGKTTILEKVVAELNRRGIRIAVIKHTPHDDLEFSKQGKDSQRLASAGAEAVIVSGPQKIAFVKKTDRDLSPEELSQFIEPGIDLLLTEGFKNSATSKIEVHRRATGSKLLTKPEQLLAVVTDEQMDIPAPQFDIKKNNAVLIADLIVKWLSGQPKQAGK
jgi:molybdopterin-guanine dinucleotide biosynthesis protein MobB